MGSAEQNGVALALWLLGQDFFLVSDKNYKWGFQTGLRGVNVGSRPHRSGGRLPPWPFKAPGLGRFFLRRFVLFVCLFFPQRKVPSPPGSPPHKLAFSIIIFVRKVIG